jgi:hypothetical protein
MRIKSLLAALVAASLFYTPTAHAADCEAGSTCVTKSDMDVFIALLREKQCLQGTKPEVTTDSIAIVLDQDGRIFASGSNPLPWTLRVKWCGYMIEVQGSTHIDAAMRVEQESGFRFRVKASMGILGVEAFKRTPWTEAVDVGVLVEPFFYHSLNLNVAVGMRSFGAGIGLDLARNFGLYAGYATAYSGLRANPYVGTYFSFW